MGLGDGGGGFGSIGDSGYRIYSGPKISLVGVRTTVCLGPLSTKIHDSIRVAAVLLSY